MNNKKIGDYICTLRKSRNLTQKELAEQLGVTDKAVSKWERGAGYPDISMLRPLAAVLGTTVNDLLEGEALIPAEALVSNSANENLNNALAYADKIISIKKYNITKIIASVLAVSLLLAIFTCVIVNVAVDERLTWSHIVTASCVFGGSLLIPPLLWKKRGFYISLYSLTFLTIPFLAVIQAVTPFPGWLWPMAVPVTFTWLITLWLIVFLIRWRKIGVWFLLSIGTLLCIPGQIITNYVIDKYLNTVDPVYRQVSTISSVIVILTIAGIFLVIGLYRRVSKQI